MTDTTIGKFLAQTTLDAIAHLQEHHPDAKLLACQVTLVVRDKGKTRFVNVIKERV